MEKRNKIFNIPIGCPFLDTVAERLCRDYELQPENLAEVLVLLPNRRACQSLQEAFVRFNGLRPSVLPRIVPIGETDEDEVFLLGGASELLQNLQPPVEEYERLFNLARLINSKPQAYGLPAMSFGQSLELAKDLARMLDTSYNEQLDLEKLNRLVPAQYAAHWQDTLDFLKIVMHYWPQILKEKGMMDSVQRQNVLLQAQARLWQQKPPRHKIIAAGITAPFPGYQSLLQTIYQLPTGEIYLSGLDKYLEPEAWEQIDESHPQFEMKHLLAFLNLNRFDIPDICFSPCVGREKFISEAMRPSASTAAWRALGAEVAHADVLSGIHVVNCSESSQEAEVIALLLREVLNEPGKTAALVTPDRELARRTASVLERWNIQIDDSAGKPLHLTAVGIFLRLILAVLEDNFSASSLLALVKNPFVSLGMENSALRQEVRQWEHEKRKATGAKDVQAPWMTKLKTALQPLAELYECSSAELKDLLKQHLQAAEKLAADHQNNGAAIVWRKEDGRQAAALFSRLLLHAETAGRINPAQYAGVLASLMASQSVRPTYGTHPRLKILGPIEARLNHFDRVVIGGVNEGVWPAIAGSDPWLSRPMKKDFGMSLPEKAIGVMAADFSRLMAMPEVWLTRAGRVKGTPLNKSRWLLRMETVLKGAGAPSGLIENSFYTQLARQIHTPEKFIKIEPPAPCPPLSARPRKLSASAVEILMRDPYEIYAAKILRLKPLQELDSPLSASDYGNLLHHILEKFNSLYPHQLPEQAYNEIIAIGREMFASNEIAAEVRAFWWPAFEKAAKWLAEIEKSYRSDIAAVYGEVSGQLLFDAPGGKFVLEARADRVDYTVDGKIRLIDYKTGEPRSAKEVAAGYAPQLPLEGLIAAHGGFVQRSTPAKAEAVGTITGFLKNEVPMGEKPLHLPAGEVEKLIYWKLGEKTLEIAKDMDQLLEDTFTRLQKLIAAFDFPSTPYLARPNPRHLLKYSNYEHLARVREWSTSDEENE